MLHSQIKIAHPSYILFVFLITLVFQTNGYGQDVQFSIPYMSPLQVNPASSGEFDMVRANLNYRSQWKAAGTPFSTVAGAFDMVLLGSINPRGGTKGRLAAGINFISDQAGTDGLRTTSINTSAAYHVQLTQTSTFGGGLSIGFDQRVYNDERGKWGSQFNGEMYDPDLISGENFAAGSQASLDLGGGLIFHSVRPSNKRKRKLNNELSIGLAAFHLGRVKLSESQYLSDGLKPRYSLFVRTQIPVGERIATIPQVYSQFQNGSKAFLYGVSAKYLILEGNSFNSISAASVQLGLMLRNVDALIINAGMEWAEYSLFLAYDLSIGKLKSYNSGRGGYEIGIRWRMQTRKRR